MARTRQHSIAIDGGGEAAVSSICAVVLTYNRKDLLADCLDAIERQTLHCDRVVVIDNASTDGTPDMVLQQWGERVELYSLPKNNGAAGGFNAGMRVGYDTGADFVWVMDDDVIAEPDALARLLAADAVLKQRNIAAPFLISTARSPGGQLTNTPTVDTRHNSLSYAMWPALVEHRLVPVKAATFVSILLYRETFAEHGLPITSMFIWGEDTEFTTRICRQRPGYLVGDSRVVHVRQQDGALNILTETNPARVRYHFYLVRNTLWMRLQNGAPHSALWYFVVNAKLAWKLFMGGKFEKAAVVLKGLLAGLRFRPEIERVDADSAIANATVHLPSTPRKPIAAGQSHSAAR